MPLARCGAVLLSTPIVGRHTPSALAYAAAARSEEDS
jgi:hypothetical protein